MFYGEVMMPCIRRAAAASRRETALAFQRTLLEHVETVWTRLMRHMELRVPSQHFTFSKVMAWLALDRGIHTAEEFGLEGPLDRWKQVRRAIHDEVCARGFDPAVGSFVQAYGSRELDASLLLLPSVGFLPATDPRILGTIAAVERELLVDGFVMRYNTDHTEDGLPPGEGAFLACSFWLADAYVWSAGRRTRSGCSKRVLSISNDVGLLAEEYDPRLGRMWEISLRLSRTWH